MPDDFAVVGQTADNGGARLLTRIGQEMRGSVRPLSLPWPRTNNGFGDGLRPAQLTVIAGPPGNGKSFAALAICLRALEDSRTWAYLPMEDSQDFWLQRAIAVLVNSWSFLSSSQDGAKERFDLIVEFKPVVNKISKCILENPRTPIIQNGRPTVPQVPYTAVVDWIHEASRDVELLVVDPVSQIDYATRGKDQWAGEQDFVRQLAGVASDSKCHIVLVAHTSKRAGRSYAPLTMDDIQGSAGFSRFAHNVILLDAHDPRESEMVGSVGGGETLEHKRTLTIAKGRSAPGVGTRIAMDFDSIGPKLKERGVIKPHVTNSRK